MDSTMDVASCPICSGTAGQPAGVVAELTTVWVTAPTHAPLPGYACVVAKRHVVEPYHLVDRERAVFWEECLLVARTLSDLFQAAKMNYEIHGNTVPHLHMHLYPRYAGDPYEGGSIDNRARFTRTAGDIDRIHRAVETAAATLLGGSDSHRMT
jgi:diadenosine tetraphosphate (Ap4A) HIT family hydrolase